MRPPFVVEWKGTSRSPPVRPFFFSRGLQHGVRCHPQPTFFLQDYRWWSDGQVKLLLPRKWRIWGPQKMPFWFTDEKDFCVMDGLPFPLHLPRRLPFQRNGTGPSFPPATTPQPPPPLNATNCVFHRFRTFPPPPFPFPFSLCR